MINTLYCQLVPLLIESLTLCDELLVLWSLTSLKLLLETKHDVFSDNIQSIIPRLLHLSTHRIMVINCAILNFFLIIILPLCKFYVFQCYNRM